MIIKTERLNVRLALDDEMRKLINNEQDEGLKCAYGEMLDMAVNFPHLRKWYAMWLIENKSSERVGELCFKGLSDDGSAEIGYGILPEFQNNGYATEAVMAVAKWALGEAGASRITAETEKENIASQKVLLKCGFKKVSDDIYKYETPRSRNSTMETLSI